jgi:hypothetical protein
VGARRTNSLVSIIGGQAGAAHGIMLVKRSLAISSSWGPVAEFMSAAGFDRLEVSKRQSVYYMLADLLVKYASSLSRKLKVPLTPKLVANCAQQIAAVFDTAFPGYVAAGLAPLVAARLTSPE